MTKLLTVFTKYDKILKILSVINTNIKVYKCYHIEVCQYPSVFLSLIEFEIKNRVSVWQKQLCKFLPRKRKWNAMVILQ